MIAETRSYIFRWRSRFRRRHVCLSSLLQQVAHGEGMSLLWVVKDESYKRTFAADYIKNILSTFLSVIRICPLTGRYKTDYN